MDTVNTRYPQIRIHQRAALELRLYRQAQEQAGTPISMTKFASEAILKALGEVVEARVRRDLALDALALEENIKLTHEANCHLRALGRAEMKTYK